MSRGRKRHWHKKNSLPEHRRPPQYNVPQGQCRWCGGDIPPQLKKDGAPRKIQPNWHTERRSGEPGCVEEYRIALNPRLAIQTLISMHGHQCAMCQTTKGPLDVDHITPLWEGKFMPHEERRGLFLITNLQLICIPCHKLKNTQEAARLAKRRRTTQDA